MSPTMCPLTCASERSGNLCVGSDHDRCGCVDNSRCAAVSKVRNLRNINSLGISCSPVKIAGNTSSTRSGKKASLARLLD